MAQLLHTALVGVKGSRAGDGAGKGRGSAVRRAVAHVGGLRVCARLSGRVLHGVLVVHARVRVVRGGLAAIRADLCLGFGGGASGVSKEQQTSKLRAASSRDRGSRSEGYNASGDGY